MRATSRDAEPSARVGAWVRLGAGTLLLFAIVVGLMQGWAPPGAAGAVVRNNLEHGIDATPLFYTEVEAMPGDE